MTLSAVPLFCVFPLNTIDDAPASLNGTQSLVIDNARNELALE